MANVAVEFLVENLMQLLRDNVELISGVKEAAESLLQDLNDFNAFLKQAAKCHINENEVLRELVKKIRTVVNSAEDAIDKFVIEAKLHKDKGVTRVLDLPHYKRVKEVAGEIKAIRNKVREIRQTDAIGLQALQDDDLSARGSEERKPPVVEEDDVVGFDEEADIVINRLLGESNHLEVVPVVGMPGLGKTTLANKIYKHPKIGYEFFTRIWVYVSQSYRRRELFLNIISKFTRNTKQYHGMCEEDLADEIQEFLGKGGKYLVVLDDVWSDEAWERIKIAFPNNNKPNRVLLTTRDSKVAKQCNPIPHDLKFLTEDESWILLEKKVFHKDKCPPELVLSGKSIAKKCKGLPLAIVVIAGALIGKGKTPREWKQVDDSVSEHLINRDHPENCNKLVQMSYDRLPYDLKACFLYCSAFPGGFQIPAWKLIRLWIAEGFIQYKGHLSLECKGEDNLNDLINRNLVMVMERTSDGQIKTCRLHDMLHEFCRQEAMKEENLFQEIKLGSEQYFPGKRELSTYRRLCIHSSVLDFFSTKPSAEHVRSFLSFSSKKIEMPSADIPTIPKGFPLLRVLDVESINFSRFSREFYQLYHLRYVAFSSDSIKILPKLMGELWNIQTIIINTQQRTLDIQANIWNMERLRHLHTNSSAKLPVPVAPKNSKVTLVNQSLQTLSTIAPESCTEEVFARTPNLKKLGIRGKISVLLDNKSAASLKNVKRLEYLENLKLINDSSIQTSKLRLPPAYIFPTKLRKLTLLDTWLEWKDMSILGQLEHLEVLKMKENGFSGESWESTGGFCRPEKTLSLSLYRFVVLFGLISCMASYADDLKSRERLRWGSPIKVYTRKRRRIQKKDDSIPISAAPDVSSNDANGYVVQAGESESAEKSERLQDRQEVEEPQLKACDLELEDGRDRNQDQDLVELINGGQGQEDTLGSQGDVDGRDVGKFGGSPIVEANTSGDVRGKQAARETDADGLTRDHAELDSTVKPVISRFRDRIRINIGGMTSRAEIKGIRRDLAGELDQVRSLVTELEAKQIQLTAHDTNTNGGSNNVGRIPSVPSGAVNSYSQPRYIDNGVMNSRALVRANSEMDLVGHPRSRPFQRPRVAVVENNNVAAEFVEKEKRTPKANQYYTNSEFLLAKDRLPPESNKKFKPNGAGRKHNGELEQGYPFGVGFGFDKHRNQVFKRCTTLLQRLMKHKHGWVFNEPVNVERLGLHDYHAIIKHPMDLGTIKARLSQNWYKSPREFAEDVRLVFHNAMTYNPKGHDVHLMSEQLLKIFEDRWAVIEAEFNPDWRYQMYHDAGLPTPASRKVPQPSPFARASVTSHPPASQARALERSELMTEPADFRFKPSRVAHVGRVPVPKKPKANDPNKRDMTYEEKQRLSTHLQSLPLEKLDAVVQIIKKRNSTFYQNGDEIEVDIDSVDVESLWELERFVTNYKKNLSKQKRKTELAQQARRTARTAPVMNSAPMVAGAPNSNTEAGRQMDNASRSSSSSSSSSDSGSSSSDSDSDSSSGSGSEGGH